jgi:hypothetical protein
VKKSLPGELPVLTFSFDLLSELLVLDSSQFPDLDFPDVPKILASGERTQTRSCVHHVSELVDLTWDKRPENDCKAENQKMHDFLPDIHMMNQGLSRIVI